MKKINKYKKPIIGISMDTGIKKTYSSYPWFAIRDDYINSIINSNGLPLMLPSKPSLADHYFKHRDYLNSYNTYLEWGNSGFFDSKKWLDFANSLRKEE